MKSLSNPFRSLAALVSVLVASFALSAVVAPAAKNPGVYWINLAGQAEEAPDFVYFYANSGGQVKNLKWKKWGSKKAVGRGYFRDTSAHYPGKLNQNGRAKIVVWKPKRCVPGFGPKEGKRIYVYRRAKLRYPNGKGGRMTADISDKTGWGSCNWD